MSGGCSSKWCPSVWSPCFHTWLFISSQPDVSVCTAFSFLGPSWWSDPLGTTAHPLQPAVCEREESCTKVAQKNHMQLCGLICRELLTCKSGACWDGVCANLDPSMTVQWHTEFHFGNVTCTVFGYLQCFYIDVDSTGFFPLLFGSRDSAVAAEIWPKPIQSIQLVDLQGQ